jgi:hypothetical protein
MTQDPSREKHQSHKLEDMLDPVSRAIRDAPLDDEGETQDERDAVAESKAWFERRGGHGISYEEVLAEFTSSPAPGS